MRDLASITGLKVISSTEGREVGTVSQAVVDLASGELRGLIVDKGPGEKGIAAQDIAVIGVDAVMVEAYKVARHLSELPDLLEGRRDPGDPPREVLTSTGKRLGVLGTIYLDVSTRRVACYEVSAGALRDVVDGVLSLPPLTGTVDGRDRVVVPAEQLAGVETVLGGLRAQLAKLMELARGQSKPTPQAVDGSRPGLSLADDPAAQTEHLRQQSAGSAEGPEVAQAVHDATEGNDTEKEQ